MTNPFLTKPNYIRIYGHRGARGDIVENSISGFKYTFDLGIKAVEFDVVISKDDIPVLFHDYRTNRSNTHKYQPICIDTMMEIVLQNQTHYM